MVYKVQLRAIASDPTDVTRYDSRQALHGVASRT